MPRLALLLLALASLAACGEEERPVPPGAARDGGATRLEVEVRPRGDRGPVERRVVTEPPAGLTAGDLAPVPPATACTEIYGGPATATVTGTLRGEPVDARFDRTNGCEIARWERAQPVLGRVPGA